MIPCKRKINVKGEGRRTGGSKRSAQFEQFDDYVNKSVKRKKYQYQRHYKPAKSRKRTARANQRSVAGGSSDSEVDSIERRTIHNSMERQRRIDLRNSFEELRKLIPHTAGNEKAAKVVILSYGAEFCKSLTMEDSELTRKKAELRRQQEMLMARVSQLRRSLAAQR
ncbi:UNVERIFIED_CONTAM: hypothetical protein PYX00_007970 [Menopon gallinae]|uniref:BHLH domain-containing protein n=1 Tax=Menopon gallinae TaxID=328185 RepID=A0AAW2HM18_9NEOP